MLSNALCRRLRISPSSHPPSMLLPATLQLHGLLPASPSSSLPFPLVVCQSLPDLSARGGSGYANGLSFSAFYAPWGALRRLRLTPPAATTALLPLLPRLLPRALRSLRHACAAQPEPVSRRLAQRLLPTVTACMAASTPSQQQRLGSRYLRLLGAFQGEECGNGGGGAQRLQLVRELLEVKGACRGTASGALLPGKWAAPLVALQARLGETGEGAVALDALRASTHEAAVCGGQAAARAATALVRAAQALRSAQRTKDASR